MTTDEERIAAQFDETNQRMDTALSRLEEAMVGVLALRARAEAAEARLAKYEALEAAARKWFNAKHPREEAEAVGEMDDALAALRTEVK